MRIAVFVPVRRGAETLCVLELLSCCDPPLSGQVVMALETVAQQLGQLARPRPSEPYVS